jgi:hypothetical protein
VPAETDVASTLVPRGSRAGDAEPNPGSAMSSSLAARRVRALYALGAAQRGRPDQLARAVG